MTTVDLAEQALSTATTAAFIATTIEIRAALTLLTLLALTAEPTAAYLQLGYSDQGDWLACEGLLDGNGDELDGSADLDDLGAASHLYQGRSDMWNAYLRPGSRHSDITLDLTVMAADLLPAGTVPS